MLMRIGDNQQKGHYGRHKLWPVVFTVYVYSEKRHPQANNLKYCPAIQDTSRDEHSLERGAALYRSK